MGEIRQQQAFVSGKCHKPGAIVNITLKLQRGITLVGFLIVLSLAIFVAFLGIKIVPIYIDHYSVVTAMKSVQKEPGIVTATPARIKDLFFRRLYVSYVDSVDKRDVKVTRQNGRTLQVKYQVQKHLIGNLEIVAKFDESVILGQ